MLSGLVLAMLLQMRIESVGCGADERWAFVVRGRDVDMSPRWSEASEAPPLAPRAAIRAARSMLGRMSCPGADAWEPAAVALRPIAGTPNAWMYVVTLVEPLRAPGGPAAGSSFRRAVEIPVLLDGTALTPVVDPRPRGK